MQVKEVATAVVTTVKTTSDGNYSTPPLVIGTYHGSVYEFFDNDKLQARGEVAPVRPPVRQNQYGFTLGGPVMIPKIYNGRQKTFFFFNYDMFKYTNAGFGSGLGTVAESQIRAGDFSPL